MIELLLSITQVVLSLLLVVFFIKIGFLENEIFAQKELLITLDLKVKALNLENGLIAQRLVIINKVISSDDRDAV